MGSSTKQIIATFKTIISSHWLITIGLISTLLIACEKPTECTINSECGTEHLCREGICKPKCLTYLTCEEGEACVDGACEIPTADYCSHVVPNQTPPDMEPFAPCPPSMLNPMTGGMSGDMGTDGGTETVGGTETAGGEETAGGDAMAGDMN